jgi:PAS domain S-box-containing protein
LNFPALQKIIGNDLDIALKILDTVPSRLSITVDKTCRKIWHNRKAAEYLRIQPWENLSASTPRKQQVTLLHDGKVLTLEELPIQRSVWKAEDVRNFEIESAWDDGIRKVSLWNSSPLRDNNGDVFGAVASFKDITEKKNAEEALRLSEEKFAKAFHHNQTMMALSRLKDSVCLDVNDVCADIMGYTKEEIIGKSGFDLFVWEDEGKRQAMIGRMAADGCVRSFENKFRKKSGEIGYSLSSHNYLDIEGEKCLLSSVMDITEIKQAEEDLRRSQKLFCTTFNSNPLPMAIITLEDTIVDVNEAFLRRGGYSRQDVVGRRSEELGIWANCHDLTKVIEEISRVGYIRNFESDWFFKPGEPATFLLSGTKILWQGKECILGIGNDITDLKRYQKEIERLGRMTLVGEISASISHEIRNPMTTVRGFLQLLKEKDRYAQDKEFMDLMIDELDRANSIITEFLSLTKNKPVELKKRSLNQKIRSIFPLISADALEQGKNIKLVLVDIPHVKIDKNEIRQLIHNLVRNGLEAMPPGGLLTIRTYREDDSVVLAVEDQGRGISPEVLEKIGTPFFTTKDSGTGLGLAVCYSIAARHQARIGIETGAEGTTFTVRFKT